MVFVVSNFTDFQSLLNAFGGVRHIFYWMDGSTLRANAILRGDIAVQINDGLTSEATFTTAYPSAVEMVGELYLRTFQSIAGA